MSANKRTSLFIALWICMLMFVSTGCVKRSFEVNDFTSINNELQTHNSVPIPMKDFDVVQPVFAQTTFNLTEELSAYLSESRINNSGESTTASYNGTGSKNKTLHTITSSGSKIIMRRLRDEAYKIDAHGIVDVLIETETVCKEQSVTETKESHFNAKALLQVAAIATGIAGAATGDTTVQSSAAYTAQTANTAPNDVGSKSTSQAQKEVCTLTIYGSALAIKYTNAIVPVVATTPAVTN